MDDRFYVGVYLSSRTVTSQVFSAQVSLTSVFGMGTGGPSPSSTPTFSFALRGVPPSACIYYHVHSHLSSVFFIFFIFFLEKYWRENLHDYFASKNVTVLPFLVADDQRLKQLCQMISTSFPHFFLDLPCSIVFQTMLFPCFLRFQHFPPDFPQPMQGKTCYHFIACKKRKMQESDQKHAKSLRTYSKIYFQI